MSQNQQQFKYSTGVVAYPVFFVLFIWVVFWLQVRFFPVIKTFGVYPQKLEGLSGILFSPFIHADIQHLYHNSIPLFILSVALFYFYRKISWKVIFYGILLSGLITWIIGRPSNHIGASGLVYVLVSFIFFKGIFAKHYRLVALSLIIIFLYGSMIWYVFPVKEGMSWEGHLGGLISGLFFAIVFRKSVAKPERYVWQQPDYNEDDDPFLKHFDENGNFIEISEPEIEDEMPSEENTLNITYTFKEKKD
ncbi:rhomboid family intramembrane serine protease [Psychroserpens ponticola]|uniref:Rhomboid family intramembrane serine protease n=1 Tax=Psychroserpens ponticola TaxID=2932268 RepID=A0ABY7RZ31_9FLAO|nr:rhomboid family intramembrane serine protease [Psychroserpens ponticola]WCO02337.1 rhomboid family intramembrane serine protease [Psychroserpens ponticola]